MKRTLLLISAVLFSVMVWGQKVTLYLSGNQTYEYDISQVDSMVFSNASTVEPEEIVVTVDANGNADGGHLFERIDESSFLIDNIKYTFQNAYLVVSGYDKVFFNGVATIISKLIYKGRTMDVVGIGSEAFSGCTNLTSINIPNSVTSIGDHAFSGCSGLTSVIIGNGVTSIGYMAFYGCSSLTSIDIPNSVTSIGEEAFSGCSGLTSIIVESGNTVYDSRNNCNAIIETATNTLIAGCQNTIIPNSVTSIWYAAFYGCSSLTSIDIPNSVTSIGEVAFSGCRSLTSITIPNSVASIGSYTFSGCSGLTSVTINSPNVGSWFCDLTSIKEVVLGENVTSIGDGAFSGCSSLTSITIPNSVASIGWCAFGNCSSLTSITIPNSVTTIGDGAFSVCSGLTSITIPNSVTSIGNSAFSGCSGLTSVTIGSGVTSIGEYAFSGCSSLTDVYCLAENVPNSSFAFDNSSFASATLHVPAGSVEAYKATIPWKSFKSIVAIE